MTACATKASTAVATARVPLKVKPTQEHLLAAFELLRRKWPGTTFDAAMEHAVRGRLITARATQLALQEHEQTHAPQTDLVRRFNPSRQQWRTYKHAGARTVPSLVPTTTTEDDSDEP
ncbi:hypothetical protein [Methylibium sp.]|uniref:hypothetical protein n=1 Tax=Methylibium sp. TaxID=2067992 RepID=UPI003BAB57C0